MKRSPTMTETTPMPMCPMAETCKGMMEKPGSGFWMVIPGVVLIALGVLIILYPQLLAWLVAIVMIVMGAAMLMMIKFMRGIGKRMHVRRMLNRIRCLGSIAFARAVLTPSRGVDRS